MKEFISPSIATGTKNEVLKNKNGGIYYDPEREKHIEVFTLERLRMYDALFTEKERQCVKCKNVKPIKEFYTNRKKPENRCKLCISAKNRKYRNAI